MGQLRLGISPITDQIYVGRIKENGYEWEKDKQNITEDFRRCLVNYCSESVVFEVDGLKFRATCEVID